MSKFTDHISITIDLDSCKNIAVKKNGEMYTLEDYLYKLVLEALMKKDNLCCTGKECITKEEAE